MTHSNFPTRQSCCDPGARSSRSRNQSGFTLVMVILLLVVIVGGILGIVAMGGRRHDAERTKITRQALPEAFRGLFPHGVGQAGDTRAANLYTDFGYVPDTPTAFLRSGDQTRSWDLGALVDRTQVGNSDGTFATPPPAFSGLNAGSSWNGPYWRGPVDGSQRPVDGWGRILELRNVNSPSSGWIVHSAGANGVDDTPAGAGRPGGDDLIYPDAPYVIPLPTPPASSDVIIEQSTVSTNAKQAVNYDLRGAQSFFHTTAFTPTKVVLQVSREVGSGGALMVSISTGANSGHLFTPVAVPASSITNTSAGASWQTVTVNFPTLATPLWASGIYYLSFTNTDVSRKNIYLRYDASYILGFYYINGFPQGNRIFFQLYGREQ